MFSQEAKIDGYEVGIRTVVQTLAQSPNFLYHVELLDPGAAVSNGTARVSAFPLASRLSFFLWSSGPDDSLLDAAARGDLNSAAGLSAQVSRMIEDPRARRGIESFHSQWLGLGRLDTASRDPKLFPEWNASLVASLQNESTKFADYVIRNQQGNLLNLLTAPFSFPSGAGRSIRSVLGADSDSPDMLEPTQAKGLLTQPAFLAAFAHTNQTSPILRGRAMRERFFCQPLPDPPPNVAAVAPPLADNLTTRERYAMHRTANGACFGCHRLIDDLGFSLEHYDPIGRYREQENNKPIDATGLLAETDIDGPVDGVGELADRMISSKQVAGCYATQWLRYALGRTESDADQCSLDRIRMGFTSTTNIRELLIAVATSDAFVRQRIEE
jgi:hypothetical protein